MNSCRENLAEIKEEIIERAMKNKKEIIKSWGKNLGTVPFKLTEKNLRSKLKKISSNEIIDTIKHYKKIQKSKTNGGRRGQKGGNWLKWLFYILCKINEPDPDDGVVVFLASSVVEHVMDSNCDDIWNDNVEQEANLEDVPVTSSTSLASAIEVRVLRMTDIETMSKDELLSLSAVQIDSMSPDIYEVYNTKIMKESEGGRGKTRRRKSRKKRKKKRKTKKRRKRTRKKRTRKKRGKGNMFGINVQQDENRRINELDPDGTRHIARHIVSDLMTIDRYTSRQTAINDVVNTAQSTDPDDFAQWQIWIARVWQTRDPFRNIWSFIEEPLHTDEVDADEIDHVAQKRAAAETPTVGYVPLSRRTTALAAQKIDSSAFVARKEE